MLLYWYSRGYLLVIIQVFSGVFACCYTGIHGVIWLEPCELVIWLEACDIDAYSCYYIGIYGVLCLESRLLVLLYRYLRGYFLVILLLALQTSAAVDSDWQIQVHTLLLVISAGV